MMDDQDKQTLLKNLPGVDRVIEIASNDTRFKEVPLKVIKSAIRDVLKKRREQILYGSPADTSEEKIVSLTYESALKILDYRLFPLVNATGVIIHTNLGRSLMCEDALNNIVTVSSSYSNVEYNTSQGKRGIRYAAVEPLLCEITGAEAAVVVNNNAGAVLLSLNTIAQEKEVIVSRGELVEIGGSFRIPDVMAKSGCILKEVGTTNRTHLKDYENAVTDNTGLLLKVHTSNFKIEGFTHSLTLADLVSLGKKKNLPVMEDLGSGTFIDFKKYGLAPEPTVSDAVSAGADIITFSGDKLLGGPQAGIILGSRNVIDRIKKNPLTRPLRIDKLTLAALESTLRLYRDERWAVEKIPTLRMLTESYESVKKRAETLREKLNKLTGTRATVETADMFSRPGGGSFPSLTLPTCCIIIKSETMSAAQLEKMMRNSRPPVICRIETDNLIIDPRTLQQGDDQIILKTIETILNAQKP